MIANYTTIAPNVEVSKDEHIAEMEIRVPNHIASWEKYGDNIALLEVSYHKKGLNYLSFHMTEYGNKSTKETFLTISPEQAKELIKFLQPFTN